MKTILTLFVGLLAIMACSTIKEDDVIERWQDLDDVSLEERIRIIESELEEERLFREDYFVLICPKCKSDSVAKILYGFIEPDSITKEKVRKREIILGGCVSKPVNCHCNNCQYEWKWKRN